MDGPDFWAWVEGSQVVEPDGRPLMVFHGSLDARGLDSVPPMTHFGTADAARDRLLQFAGRLPWGWDAAYAAALEDPEVAPHLERLRFASDRAHEPHAYHLYPPGAFLIPAYLRITKAVDIYDDGQPHAPHVVVAHLVKSWRFYDEVEDRIGEEELDAALHRLRNTRSWGAVMTLLKTLGYDGMRYQNVVEDRGSWSWIVFDPSQVWPAYADAPLSPAPARRRAAAGPRR